MAKHAAKEPELGELIDQLDMLREKYRALEEKVKPVKAEYDELEAKILSKLLESKIEGSRGKRASVNIGRSIVGSIVDWETLTAYVKKTGYYHLFNRSVGSASFRELYEQTMTKVVPGKTDEITAKRRQEAEDKFIKLTGLKPFEKISLKHNTLKPS